MNRGYKILHWFAGYNRPLEVEGNANNFVHTLRSFRRDTLEHLQHFVQGTFRKDCAASIEAEERIWSPTMKKGDECVDR